MNIQKLLNQMKSVVFNFICFYEKIYTFTAGKYTIKGEKSVQHFFRDIFTANGEFRRSNKNNV